MKKFIMLFLFLGGLLGCSKVEKLKDFKVISTSKVNENLTISELKYDSEKMYEKFTAFDEDALGNGLYVFTDDKSKPIYILFNAKGETYSNMSFAIEDGVLKLKYKSEIDEDYNQKQLFRIKTDSKIYDKILVEKNGEEDKINNVHVGYKGN